MQKITLNLNVDGTVSLPNPATSQGALTETIIGWLLDAADIAMSIINRDGLGGPSDEWQLMRTALDTGEWRQYIEIIPSEDLRSAKLIAVKYPAPALLLVLDIITNIQQERIEK